MARQGLAKLGRMYSSRYSAAIEERQERALLSPKATDSWMFHKYSNIPFRTEN